MTDSKNPARNSPARKVLNLLNHYFPCNRILAQRIFKSTVHSTVALIFCLIPKVRERLGTEPAMLPLIAVMVHPGRRASATIQGAIYCITGLIFGLAYALLGRFLAQRCLGSSWNVLSDVEQYHQNYKNYEAGLAILAVFETLMLFFHGWMRSVSHHYFHIVFPLFLVVHFTFMAPLHESAAVIANSFSTPFYMGIALSIFWNLTLFPEFGSTYLGNATVEALNEIHDSVDDAINFFVSIGMAKETDSPYSKPPVSLARLLKRKNAISKQVSNCGLVLEECMYEVSYSYVSPSQLKGVIQNFKHLAMYINALVNTCQLEFILLGRRGEAAGTAAHDLLEIQTEKEITHADARRLLKVLNRLRTPVFELHRTLSECMYTVKTVLAYAYDVKLERARAPAVFAGASFPHYVSKGDLPRDFDFEQSTNSLIKALIEFDLKFREELIHLEEDLLTPNDEMFLLSSFLMNFKETANSAISIMKETQEIYEFRKQQEAKGWLRGKSFWFIFLQNFDTFKTWFQGSPRSRSLTESQSLKGGDVGEYSAPAETTVIRPHMEEEELLAQQTDSNIKLDEPVLELPTSKAPPSDSSAGTLLSKSSTQSARSAGRAQPSWFARWLLWCNTFYKRSKAHFRFGLQVTIALMLASFPMFIPKARHWYIDIRGTWIGFVCILVLEPSVGGTFWVFFLRAVGVISGAAWGYLSYVAGVHQTNPYLEVVITVFGAAPGFYYLLGTPYIKAAIIQIISIYIVMLAAILPSAIGGSILENFAKRCLAVGYGGGVALIVQVTLFPIKARDQLNEEISYVAGCIAEMEMLYAAGLEGESLQLSLTDDRYERFAKLSQSAKAALSRADAYKGLTRQEPRLKGEYTELENVFTQIIFIQRQIVDRMDNIVLLRRQYGSAVLEELNYVVYPYRRQLVASVACLMRAVQEALINKTPLPQFLPSARIAHRRLINKVRDTLRQKYGNQMRSLKPRTVVDRFRASEDGLGGSIGGGREGERDSDSGSDSGSGSDSDSDSDSNGGGEGLMLKPKHIRRNTLPPHQYILKEKFLSWNASSAATEEVIEYIEELVQLAKILVGVNEFKYGFLSRPLYENWAAEAATEFDDFVAGKKTRSGENPKKHAAVSSPYPMTPAISEGEEEESSDEEDLEQQAPIPLGAGSSDSEDSGDINLARIASHKSARSAEGLTKGFRNRVYSIGSKGAVEEDLNNLARTKTLGDVDAGFNDEGSSSDEELPLALKRIVSRKK